MQCIGWSYKNQCINFYKIYSVHGDHNLLKFVWVYLYTHSYDLREQCYIHQWNSSSYYLS